MGLESHRRGHDLERRKRDLEVDLHVVDRQRLVVVGDVEVRWLLVAHRTADQQPLGGESEGAHAVFAVVQHVELADVIDRRRSRRDRRAGSNPCRRWCRRGSRNTGVAEHRRFATVGEVATPIEPFTLTGTHVQLEPLARDQAADLARAGAIDRSSYGYTPVPDGLAEAERYIDWLLADRDRGAVVPFAQRRLDTGELVGCTRYLELRHWRGRTAPDEVEIGGTWLASTAQRTAVNTEAKLLLLTHAFEQWEVWRVAICTDALNQRSRDAIERLGAQFEGILRSHRLVNQPGETRPRDTAVYSIIGAEWPAVRDGLVARLARAGGSAPPAGPPSAPG